MAVSGTLLIHLLLISLLQKTLHAKSFFSAINNPHKRTVEANVSQNLKYSPLEEIISKVLEKEWTEERINEIADKTVEKIEQLLSRRLIGESKQETEESKNEEKGEERNKRLMGIFRCTGWGPGCTPLDGKIGRKGKGRSKFRQLDMYNKLYRTGGQMKGSANGGSSRSGRLKSGRTRSKFQPFFTLTSGGSWGPTGKRSGASPEVPRRKWNSSTGDSDVLAAERAALRHLVLRWEKDHPQDSTGDSSYKLVANQGRDKLVPLETESPAAISLDSSPEGREVGDQSEDYYKYLLSS